MPRQAQRGSHLVQLSLSLALLVAALGVFVNRQQLFDQVMVWQYQPSPAVAAIRDRAALSEKGGFLFYASQPQLLGRTPFNNACRSVATEQTAVLGCYAKGQIFLFDINSQQLDGIKEVTAAHEMLHAAYARLTPKERERVNRLLEQQSFGADTDRIEALLAEYAKSEPGERLNELHSILGSEVRSLSPELETYYSQYFRNRSAVVALSDQYQSVFAQLKTRQESLVAELTELADTIDRRSATYARSVRALGTDIDAFNRAASSGTMSRETYDRERAALEARQSALRSEYNALQALIARYDQRRAELASINTESTALNRSINSAVSPVPDAIDG